MWVNVKRIKLSNYHFSIAVAIMPIWVTEKDRHFNCI